jgi:predicted permease
VGDLRYAFRVLRNNPGFSAAAVLTLALGIGLNATIFSIFDAVALRPVDFRGRDAVGLYQDVRGVPWSMRGGRTMFTYADYVEYRDGNDVFSGLAAYVPEVGAMLDVPIRGQLASCNYFDVLGARIAMGRGFSPADCAAVDAGAVVVLSDEDWRGRFNADPAIVGKQIKLNRTTFTVIGVAAPGFHGAELVRPAFWAPLTMQRVMFGPDEEPYVNRQDMSWLALIGTLKDGVTLAQARANLGVIAARIDATHAPRATTLTVARAALFGPDKRRPILAVGVAFLIAVSLVLLIACANIANLFLARAVVRQREIAVRLAVGASRARLVRQLLAESALVALVGGVVGTIVALWSAGAIVRLVASDPSSTPFSLSIVPDIRIFAYSLGLVALAALGFGLVPALQATRPDLTQALKTDEADSTSGRRWLRHWLIGGQVATCMVLLIAAGLFLRGVQRAQTVDPGWSMDGTTMMTFDLEREGYTPASAASFLRDLDARLRAIPGVAAVAEGTTTPLGSSHHLAPFGPRGAASPPVIEFARVSAAYLAVQRIPIVRGRDFTAADAASGRHLVILNETAARTFWPGEDPLGKIVHGFKNDDFEVIGVAADAEVAELGKAHAPYLYLSIMPPDAIDVSAAMVRSTASYPAVAGAVRTVARSLDRELHVSVAPLRDNLKPYIQATQLFGFLSGLLGALALLLASIGMYGTVAFAVARRTREIGIRVALGAQPTAVTGLVVSQAMRPVVVGALIGTALCAGVSRLLAPVLFGVSSHDAVAFSVVPLVLLTVALVASYLPARRALRVDAMAALRHT